MTKQDMDAETLAALKKRTPRDDKLKCFRCGSGDSKICDSRPQLIGGITIVARRRQCRACGQKFGSKEFSEADLHKVIALVVGSATDKMHHDLTVKLTSAEDRQLIAEAEQ